MKHSRIEKRLIRFPQLYSRIGFAHVFKPLSSKEISFIIERSLQPLNIKFKEDNFMDHEATAAVVRITWYVSINFTKVSILTF
jgi:DNA transposition AAA+ family ATPase